MMSDGQREILECLAGSGTAAHRDMIRAKALLLAADGLASTAIAGRLEVSPASVVAWRDRFGEEGVATIGRVRPGRGRKPSITSEKIDEIVGLTQKARPEGETYWSCRSMAEAGGVSPATVQRIWSARGLKPHRVKTFVLSNGKRFEEKLVDVVGLYMCPPDKAIVLCMDEKSHIQALRRTQPPPPTNKGRAATMTHEYKRNGTTTLFAALNVLTGMVTGQCLPRHRNDEFVKFLRRIDRQTPKGLHVHLIIDNHATHNHPNAEAWLVKHPRFHVHFTPTSSSWLHLVERWFHEITDKTIRRGVFHSVPDLIAAIEHHLNASNTNPKPFQWTATTESIPDKPVKATSPPTQPPHKYETPH